MKKALSLTLSLALLSGCTTMNNQDLGTLSGAAIGGLVGHNFGKGSGRVAAVGLGMMAGAAIGGQIGAQMDEQDRKQMRDALEYEPVNKAKRWQNPDSKVVYTVTPKRTYYRSAAKGQARPCREYTTTAMIGGKQETVYGTACRTEDGAWEIQ